MRSVGEERFHLDQMEALLGEPGIDTVFARQLQPQDYRFEIWIASLCLGLANERRSITPLHEKRRKEKVGDAYIGEVLLNIFFPREKPCPLHSVSDLKL